ncbi:hypothetical protein LOK49_LG13G00684 [Camellia lanceoleosa]|uniref:Uncharacterized protein n=1 Tax=Camellia lanceoleosa TaxID=1840588 RepID=A0ACC0FIP9_9ERIC|nr:hypothetical protein LOK49_LG13G00684 [Camellia lanceoleosa]
MFLSSQPPHHIDVSCSLDLTSKVGPALEQSTSALRPITSSTGPTYFVTELPDSPRSSTPTPTSGELGLSLQTPGPLPQSLAPFYALDSCLSKALKSLSLKRKDPKELQHSSRPPKLLRYDAPSSLVLHISEPPSPSLVDGIGLYFHGPPTARQPTNAPSRRRGTQVSRRNTLVEIAIQEAGTDLDSAALIAVPLEALKRWLRYRNKSYVDPVRLSGGLALWWLDEVHLKVSKSFQQSLPPAM